MIHSHHIISSFKSLSKASGILVLGVGCIVLIGWVFDMAVLKSLFPNMPRMVANTAMSFILAGIALLLLQGTEEPPLKKRNTHLAQICSTIIISMAAITLIEYILGWNLGIDQLFFKDSEVPVTSYPGRMSLHTVLILILVGASLLLMDVQIRRIRPSQYCAVAAGFIALLGLIGYAYDIRGLYLVTFRQGMAMHTAISFLILSLGILSARPDKGFMVVVSSDSPGGFIARRLLPAAIIIPPLLGWLRLKGQHAEFYNTEVGLLLIIVSNILIFVSLIGWYAGRLNRSDSKRQHAEKLLARANKTLKTISECNMALVKAGEEQELLDTICNIIVKTGGYRLAWVGFAEQDEKKTVRPAAQAGVEEGYLKTINATWANTERGRGPTHTAIRTGKPVICMNMLTDPDFVPWRAEAVKHGYPSSIAIPLINNGQPLGALNIYASAPDAFDDEEVKLLMQLADDLTYGITALRTRVAQERADEENCLLKTIALEMMGASDMKSAMAVAIHKICETTRWAYGEAWVPKSDGSALEFVRIEPCSKEHETFRLHSGGYTFPPGIGLPGRVWQSKKPEWIRDVSVNGSVYLRTVAAMEAGLRASLAAPIVADSEVLAVLVFYQSEPGIKDEQQVNLITAVAAQLGNAIQRKRAEEERIKLEVQLRQSQKLESIGQLAGGIAHDFNNLLTAIMGNASLLQMKMQKDSALMSYVDQILSTSERAANLTRGLLAFGRKQVMDKKPVGLNDVVRGVERLLSRLIGEDIEFKLELSDEDVIVMTDTGQMEQVLMNLATNARDAMPDGGLLSISTTLVSLDEHFIKAHAYGKLGTYALIAVADTGMGMDEKTRERIFDPFFTTKEAGKGTGLGLAIVYGIIKQHDGYINVYSEPGHGTIFKIYLPVIKGKGAERGVKEAVAPRGGTETILLAEDAGDVRKIARTILEEFGYVVIEAEDGEDALNKFKANIDKIRLCLLDVIMPKKNGKDVYDEVMRMQQNMKIIFVSGYSQDIIQKKAILEQGLNLLSKPFAPMDLLRRVREALDQ